MNIADLRKAIDGLADDMEVIVEFGNSQKEAIFAEVCTHENGGLDHSSEAMEMSIKAGDGLDPECWEKLETPTFKIVA